MSAARQGPLSDITIIDCTMALAGPYGTGLLADLGADVIKVEPPGGDGSRVVPPMLPDYASPRKDEKAGVDYGGYFASFNRNKRSIVLDLKSEAGREALLTLCEQADAIVENTRVGVMDRLGVGYEVVRERNPKIVYGAIRGFGDPRTGESPYANWPAFDIVAQAMSGFAHITGPAEGGGYPAGVSVGDIFPGTLMALGLVSAVHHARNTGEGQFFDVGMLDAMVALSETVVANYGVAQKSLGPRGQHHPNLMPFGIYPTSDGGVAIAALPAPHWGHLCEAMGRPDLKDDPRTANNFVRKENEAFVHQVITQWTSSCTKQQVLDALGGHVPCGPVNTAQDIFNDPHFEARDMLRRYKPPGDNPEVTIVGSPIKFTGSPTTFYREPPRLNEHEAEISEQFGLNRKDSK